MSCDSFECFIPHSHKNPVHLISLIKVTHYGERECQLNLTLAKTTSLFICAWRWGKGGKVQKWHCDDVKHIMPHVLRKIRISCNGGPNTPDISNTFSKLWRTFWLHVPPPPPNFWLWKAFLFFGPESEDSSEVMIILRLVGLRLPSFGTLWRWIVKNLAIWMCVCSFLECVEKVVQSHQNHPQVSKLCFISQSEACQQYYTALSLHRFKNWVHKVLFIQR